MLKKLAADLEMAEVPELSMAIANGVEEEEDDEMMMNGNMWFGKDSSEDMRGKEGRIIRKAKRSMKISPRKEDGFVNGSTAPSSNVLLLSKNSRKSRNGVGRGLPKKGELNFHLLTV